MDDPEFSYFAPDRLVGVLRVEKSEKDDLQAFYVELIHLTSRFGAFIRDGDKWAPVWQGWNPNPDYKYINFTASGYSNIVRAFDNSKDGLLHYHHLSQYQEILEWEGGFDNTVAPECLRDIDELVNWIQDFVEPKPEVITYGRNRVSCGDMAWMYPYVQELEALRAATEEYVLTQRKKSSAEKMEEQLTRIELYPPLTQAVDDALNEAASLAACVDCLEEFEGELEFTAVGNYFNGSKASVRDLGTYHLELIALGLGYQDPLTQKDADSFRLFRDLSLKPSNRLEAWFINEKNPRFYHLVANTQFGLFARIGKGKWFPIKRSLEVEDVYDLAGFSIVHLRPEREYEIIRAFDEAFFETMYKSDPALNKYQIQYLNDTPFNNNGYERVDFNDKRTLNFASIQGVGSAVIRDLTSSLRANIKYMIEVDEYVGHLQEVLSPLESFIKGEIEMSYPELHKILYEWF